MNLYLCPTEVITIFYSLSISGTTISGYFNIVFIMSVWIFIFSKNIICRSFISAFIANVLNSIIKLVMCFFPYLNVFIFYLTSTILLLLLNIILSSLTNLFQSWISISSLSWLLQLKDLRVGQWKVSYIRLTQENLIENSI